MSFSVDADVNKMRSDADEVERLANQYNQCQMEVFSIGRALDGCWEGDASDQFANRLQADEPAFNELFTVIMDYCTAIRECADDYEKTERNVQQQIGERAQ